MRHLAVCNCTGRMLYPPNLQEGVNPPIRLGDHVWRAATPTLENDTQ